MESSKSVDDLSGLSPRPAMHSASLVDNETEHTVSFWRDFQLDNQKSQWDKTCTEMRELKTASIAGRKRLNDLTKAFRALKSKEEQASNLFELLKAYQEEIDQLSRRSKYSESSYFVIYKALYDAPDPSRCLSLLTNQLSNQSSQSLEIEKLQRELKQYDEEFSQLKNQDITIRRLEDQIMEYKNQTESAVLQEVEKRMVVLETECRKQVEDAHERTRSAERLRLATEESLRVSQQRSDRAQAQLFERDAQHGQRMSALSSENALLVEQVQSMTFRIAQLEQQLLQQQQQQQPPTTPVPSTDLSTTPSGVTAEVMLTQLRSELRSAQETAMSDRLRLESAMREQSLLLVKERDALEKTRQELSERPTRNEMVSLRKRLQIVQKIAFQSTAEDDDDDDTNSGANFRDAMSPGHKKRQATQSNGNSSKETLMDEVGPETVLGEQMELEVLLAQKITTLDNELTLLRQQLFESRTSESDLRLQLADERTAKEAQAVKLTQLERDLDNRNFAIEKLMSELSQLQSQSSTGLTDKSSSQPLPSRLQQQQQAANEDFAQLIGVHTPTSMSSSSANTTQQPPPQQQQHLQMTAILQSQRDRYKEKLALSETQVCKLQEQVDQLLSQRQQLQTENVALFRKVKFLSSYSSSTSKQGYAYNADGRRRDEIEEGRYQNELDEVESKYSSLYEQQMNPFAEFSNIEKQRKLRELSVADRIVLNTTMAVISNPTGRQILMIYLASMHLLVFITIYYAAHNVHHGCDPALDHGQH